MTAPKRPNEPITKADLEKFIATQHDFALELYVYNLTRKLGFETAHAGSYTDQITGKTRQFDVRANRSCGREFHVHFAIECKSLQPSFPLLISQIPRLPAESYISILHSSYISFGPPRVASSPRIERLDGFKSLYPPNDYVGKASTQVGINGKAFISNDSEIFEKWGQAISSASDLIANAIWLEHRKSIIIPVLVVPDDTLWAANYAEDGSPDGGPTQVNEVKFFIGDVKKFDNPVFSYPISHLHIVTKLGLSKLLERFINDGQDSTHLNPPLFEYEYDSFDLL
ncbi:hypothetical protein O3297_00720 [Janthinobacterium sp. SUN128]|uniref:hypothetical protein n=1 Tax=Janthinobacterium sp. SUN128 TaxID=3014790 RepID=UPI002712EC69|nr:hypothetical protein [Janthinobacterium sp. SUN128]MDO8031924.1 hypothetical protein [Janthinobacterium sp. SUN128]